MRPSCNTPVRGGGQEGEIIPELDPRLICFASSILDRLAEPCSFGLLGSREVCLRCVVVGSGRGLCAVSLVGDAGES